MARSILTISVDEDWLRSELEFDDHAWDNIDSIVERVMDLGSKKSELGFTAFTEWIMQSRRRDYTLDVVYDKLTDLLMDYVREVAGDLFESEEGMGGVTMARYINGKEITAKLFAFDECHKIYLLDESQYDEYRELDYTLYEIDELPRVWTGTCPLRFINSGDLTEAIVPQFTPAKFEGWDIPLDLQWELDEMEREQNEANGEE